MIADRKTTLHPRLALSSYRQQIRFNAGTIIVLIVYCVLYSFLINKGDGVPYIMDNNETFSALNHAYNLWHFDFFKSFGLPDEAASPFAAAHPIVHTHQGDFPRLFSFLLFALGARTASAQILITTFTIGVASVLMAKSFFRRIAGDLFATIAVLLLISDYLLFAQWQINTYRVWHGFFLFGSLLCAHGLSEWRRPYWAATTILLYSMLLYWELVFAAFVAVSTGAYTLWLYRRTPRLVLLAAEVQTVGAIIGLGVLAAQSILYLGWHDFLLDINQTYGARNFSVGVASQKLAEFYNSRGVVFLGNFNSSADYSGLINFVKSIFANVLQVQTPLFALVSCCIGIASILADTRYPDASDTEIANPQTNAAATVVLAVTLPGLLFAIFATDSILGKSPSFPDGALYILILAIVIAPMLAIGLRHISGMTSVNRTIPGIRRCSKTGFYFTVVSIFIVFQGFLYDQNDQRFWLDLVTPISHLPAAVGLLIATFLSGLLLSTGNWSMLGAYQNAPRSLCPFLLSGIVGYLFVYKLSAGYLYSGYLLRLCPFLVFHVDALLALGLFVAIAISANLVSRVRRLKLDIGSQSVAAISGALFLLMLTAWGAIQAKYFAIIPPTRLSFLQLLPKLVSRNDGIISNAYPTPFALVGNTWGYWDSEARFGTSEDRPDQALNTYLWFADRTVNRSYLRPRFYICFESFGFYHGLIDPTAQHFYRVPRCSDLAIASRASDPLKDENPKVTVVANDPDRDLWAIYRLNWPASNADK